MFLNMKDNKIISAGLDQLFYWQKKDSIYSAQLICDLFGNYEVIVKTHIKKCSSLEPVKTKKNVFESREIALKNIAELKIKLTRIGYHQVFI